MDRLRPSFSHDRDLSVLDGDSHQALWFVDYADPATRRMRDVLMRSVERFRGMDLAFGVRFFPHSGDLECSWIAARAAIAAALQGQLGEMDTALFEAEPDYTRETVIELAEEIGLDIERFEEDMFSDETTQRLEADVRSAKQSSSEPQTPMLFIDGKKFQGVWDDTAVVEAIQRPLGVRISLASTAFISWAASSGLVLVTATLAALAVVNFGLHDWYEGLRQTEAGFSVGNWELSLTLEKWVNDGLMALFFLIVGIEIKREMVDGELSDMQSAALPLVAALGGMVVPAGIYMWANWGESTAHGWGVPMATDIAFTLGILALLGSRVPTSLKVFVSALAIADDLGAIVVIAIFYGHGFDATAFIYAAAILAIMMLLNFSKVYSRTPYILLAVVLWYFVHESGLHATIAGVLTAAAIPSRPAADIEGVAMQAGKIFERQLSPDGGQPSQVNVQKLKQIIDRLREPGYHLQHELENWSSYVILPLFAFLNTGILLVGSGFVATSPEVMGTMLGLLIGKPVGICLFVLIAMKLGIARLSSEISWRHLIGAGFLCGIGFTMSIFIASAAFEAEQLQSVKLAVLLSSLFAAIVGTAVLMGKPHDEDAGSDTSEDEGNAQAKA